MVKTHGTRQRLPASRGPQAVAERATRKITCQVNLGAIQAFLPVCRYQLVTQESIVAPMGAFRLKAQFRHRGATTAEQPASCRWRNRCLTVELEAMLIRKDRERHCST